jgi:N6-adenosine-specific RNA methylase IME4
MPVITELASARAYRAVVADPPWTPALGSTWATRFTDKARPQRHYGTMSVEAICALPVPAAERAHLYLWAIDPHVDWGYRVARAWGFEVWNMLTWCKPGLGTGRFQRNTEHVLMGRRGPRHGNPFGATGGTWFGWPRHSAKPAEFYALVGRCSSGPYLDLFARHDRAGWDCWGDECIAEAGLFS